MQYCQNNLMRIIGNDQKNNGHNFWEILERIMGKILSIIGAGLAIYVTGHEKIGLMCTQNLTTFLNFKLQ